MCIARLKRVANAHGAWATVHRTQRPRNSFTADRGAQQDRVQPAADLRPSLESQMLAQMKQQTIVPLNNLPRRLVTHVSHMCNYLTKCHKFVPPLVPLY